MSIYLRVFLPVLLICLTGWTASSAQELSIDTERTWVCKSYAQMTTLFNIIRDLDPDHFRSRFIRFIATRSCQAMPNTTRFRQLEIMNNWSFGIGQIRIIRAEIHQRGLKMPDGYMAIYYPKERKSGKWSDLVEIRRAWRPNGGSNSASVAGKVAIGIALGVVLHWIYCQLDRRGWGCSIWQKYALQGKFVVNSNDIFHRSISDKKQRS